ncbi:MAG: hypothetical protein LBT59_25760 [Clostridiales bacterium]|jgi:glucosamine 6-phosphate synthetase-like amidotransferase/phosphosugar isomerase protein|nr:hypothetical protein [Clostridiales bacterium]
MQERTIHSYWKSQPEVWSNIIKNRKSLTAPFAQAFLEEKPDKIFLIGSGTSLNAINAAAPFIEEVLGLDAAAFPPSRPPLVFCKRPLFVFLSQGGSSTNTLEAMELFSAYPQIAAVGDADCEIAKRCKRHMLIGCGPELIGPKMAGFTSSVLILCLSALEAARSLNLLNPSRLQEYDSAFESLPELGYENLSLTEAWLARNQNDLSQISKYVLVGQGYAGFAAAEGALKIQETVKVPAIGFEFEEYLHGPMLMTSPDLGGLFFISEKPAAKHRMLELASCHKRYSKFSYSVSSNPSQDPQALTIRKSQKPYTEVFEFVLAAQLIAALIPGILGIADGSEVYDSYTKACATKFNNGR